jgi:hypothetical protein
MASKNANPGLAGDPNTRYEGNHDCELDQHQKEPHACRILRLFGIRRPEALQGLPRLTRLGRQRRSSLAAEHEPSSGLCLHRTIYLYG